MNFPSPGEWFSDRGKAMAEFVIAFPVFLVILVGVIDLGVNFGDGVQVGQGAKDALAAAKVVDVGTRTDCDIASSLPMATLTKQLICMTKASTHLNPSTVRVKVFYESPDGQATTDYQPTFGAHSSDARIVVCVMSPERSVTGLLGSVFDHRAHTARVSAQVGTPVRTAHDHYAPTAAERPLAGLTWSFCKPDVPSLL